MGWSGPRLPQPARIVFGGAYLARTLSCRPEIQVEVLGRVRTSAVNRIALLFVRDYSLRCLFAATGKVVRYSSSFHIPTFRRRTIRATRIVRMGYSGRFKQKWRRFSLGLLRSQHTSPSLSDKRALVVGAFDGRDQSQPKA